MRLRNLLVLGAISFAACSSTDTTAPPASNDLTFGAYGSSSAASGKGSFRFGAASAATQIEDQNTNTDWYAWTDPKGGIAKGTFVGDAVKGYTKSIEDLDIASAMHLDSYRMSIEWARVEPKKGMIDEAALDHYSKQIDAMIKKGIRPMITIHHFSNPIWVDDPNDGNCKNGPTDANLCGLDHPQGGAMVVKAMADHARLLAKRFGDRVDDWGTLNEPVNYLLAAYGTAGYPPGKLGIMDIPNKFMPAIRNYINAHVAMYKAIKEADTIDADGDGVAASVGFTKEAAELVPARNNELSDFKQDIAARDGVAWVYNYLFVEAIRQGGLDTDFDQTIDEPHPDWKGTLDWLGVQYYVRAGVTGQAPLIPLVNATPCFGTFDLGSCVPPLDPTYTVPQMGYEHDPAGLGGVLSDFAKRWPDLPLIVTESGIATEVGARRAEVIVRDLEQIAAVRAAGADVRGYYHWSLTDNFEWAYGFKPHFGLYSVDYTTYARTPTEGATVLGEIAKARVVTDAQRKKYGGTGPMTPETK